MSGRENSPPTVESISLSPEVDSYPSLGSVTNNLQLGTGSPPFPSDSGTEEAFSAARVVFIILILSLLSLAVRYRNSGATS